VDLAEKPISRGELLRFVQRFGIDALIDKESNRFEAAGLRHARLSDDRWLQRLMDDPLLLRLPLTRRLGQQADVAVGDAEETWRMWSEY